MLMTSYEMDMHIEPGHIAIMHDTSAYIDVLGLKRMLLIEAGVSVEDGRTWLEVEDRLAEEGKSELTIKILTDDLDDYFTTWCLSRIHYLLEKSCTHKGIFDTEIRITLY